ncbi:MAG: phytanoyl-CoA dioxygenase family protein [Planctomycetia bacterium]
MSTDRSSARCESARVSQESLDAPYALAAEEIRRFREDGFVRLPGVFEPAQLVAFEEEISRLTFAEHRLADVPMAERSTYGRAFIQVMNLWTKSDEARRLGFSKRLARIATELLGTRGVRMWHDQSLFKEPSGGFTPWHADQQYWPMASGLCATAWIPLHAVPLEQGPLSFAKGSHLKRIGHDLEISDESERIIGEELARARLVEVVEPYAAGDVSFHLGWTLHRAGPNTTDRPRKVHTVIFMDRDMRLAEPRNANQEADHHAWTPSTRVGDVMADPLNPVLFEW